MLDLRAEREALAAGSQVALCDASSPKPARHNLASLLQMRDSASGAMLSARFDRAGGGGGTGGSAFIAERVRIELVQIGPRNVRCLGFVEAAGQGESYTQALRRACDDCGACAMLTKSCRTRTTAGQKARTQIQSWGPARVKRDAKTRARQLARASCSREAGGCFGSSSR
eukprot:g13938.t1